jgi:hypothetical protein
VVEGPGRRYQFRGLCFGERRARIGELAVTTTMLFEVAKRLLGPYEDDDTLAAFVRGPDRQHLHPGRRRLERPVVTEDVLVVSELSRRTNVVAEYLARCRDAIHDGEMIDQRAQELGESRPLANHAGELAVLALFGARERGRKGRDE